MIGPEFEGRYKWGGGAVDLNGNVFGMPSDADCVLRIDGETDEVTVIGKGALGPDIKNKWQGAVLAPDGRCTPSRATPRRLAPHRPGDERRVLAGGDPLGRAGQVAGRLPRRERRHLLHPGKRRPRPADRPARRGTEEARAEGKKKKKENTRDAAGLSAVLAAAAARAPRRSSDGSRRRRGWRRRGASLSLGVAAGRRPRPRPRWRWARRSGGGEGKRKLAETRGAQETGLGVRFAPFGARKRRA